MSRLLLSKIKYSLLNKQNLSNRLSINVDLNLMPKFVFNFQSRSLQYIPIETDKKIEIGHKMTQVIEKHRQKFMLNKLENEKYSNNQGVHKSNKKLLIACSNPQFNHYTGQAYKNFSERFFASYGWRNRKSAGQYFTVNPIRTHPSIIDNSKLRNERDEIIEFEDLNLNSKLIDILKNNLGLKQPTLIQYLSLNEIFKRDSHKLIVAETGGGKTLTYAIPMLESAIRVKNYLDEMKLIRKNNQPIGIIIVPTRELAFQVYNLFNSLTQIQIDKLNTEEDVNYLNSLKNLNIVIDLHKSQIKAKENVTKEILNSLDKNFHNPIDILITLPGQLQDRVNDKFFNSAYIRQIVLDEADTLLDDSFNEVTLKCLNKLNISFDLPKISLEKNMETEEINYENESNEFENKSKQMEKFNLNLNKSLKDPSVQLLFVSATVPRDMNNILQNLINCENELKFITTSKTNQLMLHIPQKFIRTNGTKRPLQLLEIIKKELSKKNFKRTIMIFSQKTNTATYVSNFLKENDIDCELLTKKCPNQQREEIVNKFFNGQIRVLSCTDIASRGWNTLHVNHVINFEMPEFIADYLHRVGRVGRLNGHKYGGEGGLVTNFITNRFEVDLVWNIERSLRLGIELHNVNANIKRLYKYSFLKEENEKIKDDKLKNKQLKFSHNDNRLLEKFQHDEEQEEEFGSEKSTKQLYDNQNIDQVKENKSIFESTRRARRRKPV